MASVCAARDHIDGFDGDQPSWEAVYDKSTARLLGQVRSKANRHQGEASELFEIEGLAPVTIVQLYHSLPPARLIDDLILKLWVHSNQDGIALGVRIVLPRQIDPRTGKTMTLLLDGASYTKPGQWKELRCAELPTQLQRLLPRLRKSLQVETGDKQDIDSVGAYVDAVVVTIRMDRGRSQFALDDLQLGPIVEAEVEREVQQASGTETRPRRDAEFKLDQLCVRDQPFFLRVVPYHGETAEDLARMRFNVVWIRDYQDTTLLSELEKSGLRAMAVPPRPTAPDGTLLDPESAQIAPFGPATAPILFWYLGTRIAADSKREVAQWDEQIRNADRALSRPVTGDVAGSERAFSRQLKMLGVSRTTLHTSFGLRQYRDWLIEHRLMAQPGSVLWTWLATEPPASVIQQRQAAGHSPLVIEPEQLRMQLYAALASGYRGVGFWTQTPLSDDAPGAVERKLMLAQLNMELELLEFWLATGTLASQTPFSAQMPQVRKLNQLDLPGGDDAKSQSHRSALLNNRKNQQEIRNQVSRDLEAAILRTDAGVLVLPIWYADDAQFVPGQMTANNARIVVPGVGEAARAWEISTTGITSLETGRVTGGKEITLKKFDMTTAILFTDDANLVERLRAKVAQLAETSARVCLELSRAKLQRVVEVDRRLHELGKGHRDAPLLLGRAKSMLDRAETYWQNRRFQESRLESADCLQLLRILQHGYWVEATSRIYAPVSSPHTLCFQTLPDHWDMVIRHGQARHAGGANLLRSGDFEDRDTMVAEGWKHEQTEVPGVRADAELYPKARKGGGSYCLRLIATAATGQDPPKVIADRPVSVTTPPVTVYKGQIVHINGWVRVAAPSLGNLDGALLYDNLGGPSMALRWRSKADWQPFDLVREVNETGELTVTIALTGLGEICFDDLQIIPLDGTGNSKSAQDKPASATRAGRGTALDLLKRIPRLGVKGETE